MASKPVYEVLQFLAFIDYGLGVNHITLDREREYRYLLGTGFGMRYYYGYHVSVRFDRLPPPPPHCSPNHPREGNTVPLFGYFEFLRGYLKIS